MKSKIFYLVLCSAMLMAGCRSADHAADSEKPITVTAQEYIRRNLGWDMDVDRNYCYNFGSQKNARPLDASAKVFCAMALRRRASTPAEASAANQALAEAQNELIAEVRTTPTELNTFVLAELLNFPAAPVRDHKLAIHLYRYSAKSNYPPAMTRLGALVRRGELLKRDDMLTEKLLRNADDAGVAEAGWELYLFHHNKNHNFLARKPLRRSQGKSHPEALAEAVDDTSDSESTREELLKLVRSGSGNAAVKLAGLPSTNWQNKLELLQIAALNNNEKAPLMLATMYLEKPLRDYPMAINSALLALGNYSTNETAARLLLELDKDMPLGLVLAAMWQDTMMAGNDIAYAMLDNDILAGFAMQRQFSNCYLEINKFIARPGTAVYRNGVLLRLVEYGFPLKTLQMELDNHFQNNHEWLLTKLIVSSQNGNTASQRSVSAELLAYIKRQQANKVNINLRRDLISVIPGVAELELPKERFSSDAGKWRTLWNIAVLMHVDALMKNGEKAKADDFLRRNPLHRLPEPFNKLQKNFAKNFAPALINR